MHVLTYLHVTCTRTNTPHFRPSIRIQVRSFLTQGFLPRQPQGCQGGDAGYRLFADLGEQVLCARLCAPAYSGATALRCSSNSTRSSGRRRQEGRKPRVPAWRQHPETVPGVTPPSRHLGAEPTGLSGGVCAGEGKHLGTAVAGARSQAVSTPRLWAPLLAEFSAPFCLGKPRGSGLRRNHIPCHYRGHSGDS